MKKVIYFGISAAVAICCFSCNNSASDPNNTNSKIGYDSLSEAGDTVTTHASDFSTAIHQMMNDMNQLPITGNTERDFALLLKSNLSGAVDLAQAELKRGKDDGLKQMAKSISDTGKVEIATLENLVDSLKNGPLAVKFGKGKGNKDSGFSTVIKTHKAMMWDMSKMDTNMVADKQFVATIIQHIQSTVYLTEGFLKYGKDARLIGISKRIISQKTKQLDELKEWMKKN